MSRDDKVRNIDLEWENRVLCSDESCIGTIGPDGRCRECGLAYKGELPSGIGEINDDGSPDTAYDANDIDDEESAEQEADSDVADDDDTEDADDEWSRRILCIDESCIGVVGKGGRCKECGKPHPG